MSVKLIEKLPSKDLPWFRRYTIGENAAMISVIYAKDSAYKKHFGLPMEDFMISEIAVTEIRVIDLLRINECGYMDLAYLKKLAAEFKLKLDNAWFSILNNPKWNFYYINRESGLSKDVYNILDIILDYNPVI